jgi:hypothetical protein
MTDREKVIKGLYEAVRVINDHVPVRYVGYAEQACWDALTLLREQKQNPDCEHAEWDGTGCLGYCGCTQDDEPIEVCKRCRKYTGNIGGENTDD